jgi:hypothetical protein
MKKETAETLMFGFTRKQGLEWKALAERGNIRELTQITNWIIACIRSVMWQHPAAAEYLFRTAQALSRDAANLSKLNPPPPWLVKMASKEHEVPCLIQNGKPAAWFDESDTALRWGNKIMRRGKSQFTAPQTKAVADALHSIEAVRALDARMKYAALPPLSQKTKAQWWRKVQAIIKRNIRTLLTERERKSIRATLDHDTESALINEYLKRCKKAFNALCPAD